MDCMLSCGKCLMYVKPVLNIVGTGYLFMKVIAASKERETETDLFNLVLKCIWNCSDA